MGIFVKAAVDDVVDFDVVGAAGDGDVVGVSVFGVAVEVILFFFS